MCKICIEGRKEKRYSSLVGYYSQLKWWKQYVNKYINIHFSAVETLICGIAINTNW